VNAIIPPLALDGPVLSIRRFAADPYRMADLIEFGTLPASLAEILRAAVQARLNILRKYQETGRIHASAWVCAITCRCSASRECVSGSHSAPHSNSSAANAAPTCSTCRSRACRPRHHIVIAFMARPR